MEKITIGQATKLTAPNPLTLVCTEKPDGSTNIAPVSFVSFLSFDPPMIGFAMGKAAYTSELVNASKKVVITVPGKELADKIIPCGASSGRDTAKTEKFGIAMQEVPDSAIKRPAHCRAVFVADVQQTVETGDHYFYVCAIRQMYGDSSKEALFAWQGYAKAAPAREK